MKIIAMLSFTLPGERQCDIRGVFNSPDRPLKGSQIYWPKGRYGPPDNDSDVSFRVYESDSFISAKGKVLPWVQLEWPTDTPKEGFFHLESKEDWKEIYLTLNAFLDDMEVWWGVAEEWEPWPNSMQGLPEDIMKLLK